jgi:hypothetical protein
MNVKTFLVVIFFIFVFIIAGLGSPVFADWNNPEMEFLIENARVEINKQEAVIAALYRRYENTLKRKKELLQFIDQENKKIKEVEFSKSKIPNKPLKAAPVAQKRPEVKAVPKVPLKVVPAVSKRPGLKAVEKTSEKTQVLREEKEFRKQELSSGKRNSVVDEVLRQQEKTTLAVAEEQKQANIRKESLKRHIAEQEAQLREKENKIKLLLAQENAKKDLEAKKQKQVKFLAEQKAKEQEKLREAKDKAEAKKKQQAELEKKKKEEAARISAEQKAKEQKSEALAKQQKKERELLSKKLEKERLLAEEKEKRVIREKECQMRLLLEADKNAKHERYVNQLGQLLNRQNYLLEESRKLESQIYQEEETLKVLERTRQELIRKLLENPRE